METLLSGTQRIAVATPEVSNACRHCSAEKLQQYDASPDKVASRTLLQCLRMSSTKFPDIRSDPGFFGSS